MAAFAIAMKINLRTICIERMPRPVNMARETADFAFRTRQHPAPTKLNNGEVRVVDSSSFEISATIAAAMVTVKPGGMPELH
jgi:oxalate decarboxylase/phosphoglucose isomerase-like protein (cupin superfamily)